MTASGFLVMTGCMLIGFAATRDAIEAVGAVVAMQRPQLAAAPLTRPVPQGPSQSRSTLTEGLLGSRTCPQCHALPALEATSCPRCRHEFARGMSGTPLDTTLTRWPRERRLATPYFG